MFLFSQGMIISSEKIHIGFYMYLVYSLFILSVFSH